MVKTAPSPLAVFRNRSFSLLWTGQLISTIGSALSSLAASILVFNLTHSALSVGLMLMATAAPSLLVGLVAGVFVDRFDRRRIMIACDGLRAILAVLIPVLVPLNIIWLYVIVALSSAIGQFFEPAHSSVLPELSTDEELAAANSLIAISSFGSTAIGFAASGLIASRYPIAWAFYADAVTFLFSALAIVLIRIKPLGAPAEDASLKVVADNLKAGLRFLFDTPILRSLLLSSVPVLIGFGLSNALLLPFAIRALHASEFEYGLQEGLTSVGFVVGSLLMANLADRWREGQWISLSFLGMGLAGAAYAFMTNIPLAIAIVAVSGFLNAPSAIARRLIIQRHTPREMRGRVSSAFFVSRDVLFLVGMGLAGLADAVDVRWMYLISALMIWWPGLGAGAARPGPAGGRVAAGDEPAAGGAATGRWARAGRRAWLTSTCWRGCCPCRARARDRRRWPPPAAWWRRGRGAIVSTARPATAPILCWPAGRWPRLSCLGNAGARRLLRRDRRADRRRPHRQRGGRHAHHALASARPGPARADGQRSAEPARAGQDDRAPGAHLHHRPAALWRAGSGGFEGFEDEEGPNPV